MAITRAVVLVTMILAAQAALAGEVVDRIVAVVNGEIITLFEVNEHLKPMLARFKGRELSEQDKQGIAHARKELLDKMIEDRLLDQQVKKLGVTVAEFEVENELERIRTQSKLDPEDFEQQLKLEGLTVDQMKQRIRDDILKHRLLGAMVKRKVVVSEEEVRAYYDAHKADYIQARNVDLSVILAPSLAQAEELARRIAKGELTFEDAAREYSQGPGAAQGGSLGTMDWPDLAPDWRDALVGVQTGGMSKPFDFRGFGAVLKLNAEAGGGERPFEDAKNEIDKKLYQQQLEERFSEYIQGLRENAVIDVKL